MGHKFAFDPSRLTALYNDEKSYAATVARSVDRLVKDHWLTEGDARRVRAESAGAWR